MVTPAELKTSAESLRNYNTNFKNQVTHLETTEGTLNSQWEGEAKNAFHKAFMDDKTFFDAFAELIEKFCQALDDIAAKYEAAEAQNLETATTRTAR